jgi:uncharacterized coiled-coil protein SlyX
MINEDLHSIIQHTTSNFSPLPECPLINQINSQTAQILAARSCSLEVLGQKIRSLTEESARLVFECARPPHRSVHLHQQRILDIEHANFSLGRSINDNDQALESISLKIESLNRQQAELTALYQQLQAPLDLQIAAQIYSLLGVQSLPSENAKVLVRGKQRPFIANAPCSVEECNALWQQLAATATA